MRTAGWRSRRSSLVAENVTFANDVLQKEAAFQFYDAIGVDQHQIAATASVSGTWSAAAAEYGGPVMSGLAPCVTGAAIGAGESLDRDDHGGRGARA